MIDKKFAAIVLAIGLFLSIGYAVSQSLVVSPGKFSNVTELIKPTNTTSIANTGSQSISFIETPIQSYYIIQYTLSASNEATIVCVLTNGRSVALKFLKDGAPVQQNSISETDWSYLNYPYSRYNDVLALLKTGNVKYGRETGTGADPAQANIRTT